MNSWNSVVGTDHNLFKQSLITRQDFEIYCCILTYWLEDSISDKDTGSLSLTDPLHGSRTSSPGRKKIYSVIIMLPNLSLLFSSKHKRMTIFIILSLPCYITFRVSIWITLTLIISPIWEIPQWMNSDHVSVAYLKQACSDMQNVNGVLGFKKQLSL